MSGKTFIWDLDGTLLYTIKDITAALNRALAACGLPTHSVEAVQGSEAAKICRKMTDLETELCYLIEREVLRQLSADCSEAVAAWCRTAPCVTDRLLLDVMYAGNRVSLTCPASVEEGRQLAWQAAQMVKGA